MTNQTEIPGAFSWMELHCADAGKAQSFYTSLLGWGTKTVDVGVGPYTMIMNGGDMIGAIPDMSASTPRWLPYVTVDNVDARVEKARSLGATITCEPTNVPQVGRFAILTDPVGGVIALITYETPSA